MLTAEHDLPHLPWGAIAVAFEPLLEAFPNLLERETPASLLAVTGAPHIVLGLTHLAVNTHRAIRFLSATSPDDPSRKLEYSLVLPALSRTILEGLFSLAYMLEDLEARTSLYCRGGWRELHEEHERYRRAYGARTEWQEYLSHQEAVLDGLQSLSGISAAEALKPSSVPYWPIPSQLLRGNDLSSSLREFLQYLNDWFYGDLSKAAHLSWPALTELSGFFLFRQHPDAIRALDKRRSDWFVASLILLLCHLSELEGAFRFGRAPKLTYCWSLLTTDFLPARELYTLRYQALLESGA